MEVPKKISYSLINDYLECPFKYFCKRILKLDVTTNKLTPSKASQIAMTYTNENATQYESGNGVIEKEIQNIKNRRRF